MVDHRGVDGYVRDRRWGICCRRSGHRPAPRRHRRDPPAGAHRRDRLLDCSLGPPPGPRLLPDLPGGTLADDVVSLRPLAAEDTPAVHYLRSLPEVVAATVPPVPPPLAYTSLCCAHAASEWLAGTAARLTIGDAASDAFVGEIDLCYAEPTTAQATLGCYVAPAWRGRGVATRAVRLVARWALTEAGIARLVA